MMDYCKLSLKNSALITIDIQTDTLDGQPFEVQGTSKILPNVSRLLSLFRRLRLPIIHIVRIYEKDGSNAELCRKEAIKNGAKLIIKGSLGSQIAQELFEKETRLDTNKLLKKEVQTISKNEVIIYKPRWGAFYKTPLNDYLTKTEINSLIFTGCNFPNCPRTSIYQASERDYKIALIEDALSGLYPKGIEEMKNIGVNINSTSEIINKISSHFNLSLVS